MQKLSVSLALGMMLSSLILTAVPTSADEPRYNLGAIYDKTFPKIEQGTTGESTIYFYSAFGDVTCYITATADSYPDGWQVQFDPVSITVEPQWFENAPFEVSEGETCLQLSYEDENGISRQGWVRAYPMEVHVTVPKDVEPGSYEVRISYVGDFRMSGMSVVKRSGGIGWTIEVESEGPTASSGSNILLIGVITICAVVVGTVIAIIGLRW